MGDSRRHAVFADAIARQFPALAEAPAADVAGGRGGLQAEMRRRGFTDVVSWDVRRHYAKARRFYRYGRFDHRNAPRDYRLVVGMHPDGATDEIVAYAVKHRVPFAVCPCCVLPTATRFDGVGYAAWIAHLARVAEAGRMRVDEIALPITGRNIALVGRPLNRPT